MANPGGASPASEPETLNPSGPARRTRRLRLGRPATRAADRPGSTPEVFAPPGPETEPAAPRRWSTLPWALFVVALAAAVAFGMLWQRSERAEARREQAEARRREVAATAGRFLVTLTNFRGATIRTDVQRIRSYAVADFAGQLHQFFGPDTVSALQRAQAVSTGRVDSLFVEDIGGSTASVFGVVDETVTGPSAPTPRREVLRLDVQMIETSGGWKVSRVDILQSPANAPFGSGP